VNNLENKKVAKNPYFEEDKLLVPTIKPGDAKRAVYRYNEFFLDTVFYDSRLEGLTYTKPEIETILEKGLLNNASDFYIQLVKCLSNGFDFIKDNVEEKHKFSLDLMCKMNTIIDSYESFEPGIIRDRVKNLGRSGYVKVQDDFTFIAPNENLTSLLEKGIRMANSFENKILAAAYWQAFATYNQPFMNGNKRTARYVSNLVLLSNGYDAILVPESKSAEYNEALFTLFKTDNMTDYMNFLISLYPN
jgi:Fic family protein